MKASGGVALAIVLALAGCAGSDRAPAAVSSVAVNEERVTIPADPIPSTYRPAQSDVTVIRGATMFDGEGRSEEHTSELQSPMRFSYAACCSKTLNLCVWTKIKHCTFNTPIL